MKKVRSSLKDQKLFTFWYSKRIFINNFWLNSKDCVTLLRIRTEQITPIKVAKRFNTPIFQQQRQQRKEETLSNNDVNILNISVRFSDIQVGEQSLRVLFYVIQLIFNKITSFLQRKYLKLRNVKYFVKQELGDDPPQQEQTSRHVNFKSHLHFYSNRHVFTNKLKSPLVITRIHTRAKTKYVVSKSQPLKTRVNFATYEKTKMQQWTYFTIFIYTNQSIFFKRRCLFDRNDQFKQQLSPIRYSSRGSGMLHYFKEYFAIDFSVTILKYVSL
eukprot:TRINITY_DN11139_c0_g4_i3.p1 TRINITY_DN11139_c0_g4~~TRINITY_DN11139_c0_g4_i3.p1  ORF type:complete len:272 (-),score=-21.02 TRINITY_DN11139_c0_g4_i3:699-1514(-)